MSPIYLDWDATMTDYHRQRPRSRSLVGGLVLLLLSLLAALGVLLIAKPAGAQTSTVHAGVDPIGWLAQPFTFSGWALDTSSAAGTGVDVVHVWAHPMGAAAGGDPIFLGAATYGHTRPDGEIAAALGLTYTDIGWQVEMPGLPPGQYDVIFSGTTNPTSTGVPGKFESETAVVRITVVAP